MGHLLVNAGEPKEAIGYLSSALRLDPGNADLRHELAGAHLANHHPELVLELISSPVSAEDHYLRGGAYFSQHHMPEAERESSLCVVKNE